MWMVLVGIGILLIASIPYVVFFLLSLRIEAPEFEPEQGVQYEPVSILVPTYNEASIVEGTLERLCSLEYPDDLLELVIVDSSDDGTADVIRDFFDDRTELDLTLIEENDRGGVARAVNRGVMEASHGIIFRTDCDARLDPGAVDHAVATLQDREIGGVTGRQVEVIGDSAVEESYRSMQARNHALETQLDSVFMVHGPCFAFRKGLFEEIPLDTIADDTEIAVRGRKKGKRVVMNPAMRFAEVGVSDIRKRRGRKDRRAMGLLQVLWRHRDVIGRHGRYGKVVVPFNWWFLGISPWLMIGGLGLFLVGAVLAEPVFGALAVLACGGFILLGQRDLLGPLGSMYTVLDSHISLVIGGVRLLIGGSTGVWRQDVESRDILETGGR